MKSILSVLVSAIIFASPVTFAKNNKQAGAVLGAVVGAVIGNEVGDGNSVATVIGAIAGAAIGSSVGEQLDQDSQREMSESQARALERAERESHWRGRDYYGSFYVTRTGYYRSSECRSYENHIYNRYGQIVERTTGTTCRTSSGWTESRYSSVTWF